MGTKSSCVTHNFYITTTSGIKQIWEQSTKSELQIGLKNFPQRNGLSLSTPLFNLEIYFDKVLEHDSYFRGAGLNTWLPLFLTSVESEINTEERQQVNCEAEGVEGEWTKAGMSPASLVAQMVKNLLQCRRLGFDPWVGKIPWRRNQQPTPVFLPAEFHGLRSQVGYRVAKRWTWLSNFYFHKPTTVGKRKVYMNVCTHTHIHIKYTGMYVYITCYKIPWTEEPDRLYI